MRFILFAAAAFSAAPAAAEPVSAEIVGGVDYQQGDYVLDEPVEIVSIQGTVRLRAGRATLSATLPWHRIEAPGNVVGGTGPLGLPIVIDPNQPAAREARQGIGDLRLAAGYTLAAPAGVTLTLGGQVKLPTASAARGIGTGETDVSVGAEAARSFGAVTPFVALGYTMPGDPEGYRLSDTLSARGGIELRLSPALRGNVSYGYAESASAPVPDEQQVATGIVADLSRRLSLGVHGNAGLSRGAPDLGVAVSLGVRAF